MHLSIMSVFGEYFVCGAVLSAMYILYTQSAYVCVLHLIVVVSCFLGFLSTSEYMVSFHSNCTFANVRFILNGYRVAVPGLVDLLFVT